MVIDVTVLLAQGQLLVHGEYIAFQYKTVEYIQNPAPRPALAPIVSRGFS